MGILQAIKNGFSITTKNLKLWVLLVVISLVLMMIGIPIALAIFGEAAFQPGAAPTPEQMAKINWPLFAVFIFVMVLIQTFVNAGVVGTLKDVTKGESWDLNSFLGNAKKFFGRFVLFTIVMSLIGLGLFILFLLSAGLAGIIGNAVAFLGVLVGIILFSVFCLIAILMGAYGSFGPIVIAIEDKGLFQCMGRALNFIKERLWNFLGLLCILGLIFLGALVVFILIFFLIGLIIGITTGAHVLSPGTQATINIVSRVIWNLAVTYLTLVFVSSLISYYLGNKSGASPSPETAQF